MIRSMTGFGHAEGKSGEFDVRIEIRSVNHKSSEYRLDIPRDFASLEPEFLETARRYIKRGQVRISVRLENSRGVSTSRIKFNTELARKYYQAAKEIAKTLKIRNELGIAELIRLPGVCELEEDPLSGLDREKVIKILEKACESLLISRKREGERLLAEFKKRIKLLRGYLRKVKKLSSESKEKHRENIRKRLSEHLSGLEIDEGRLLSECALLADRSDISEEIARVESHLDELENVLTKKDGPHGKRLDFIMQELLREFNTMSTKAIIYDISRLAVESKATLEEMREQIQNIE